MWGDEKINHPYPKSHSRFNATGRFMKDNQDILSLFHPLLARWFRGEVGRPTRVQTLAWPLIAQGGHVLVSAPTGSGKTLTAFLHALDQFAQGRLPLERTSILYVSPLKALNNDIQRNLLGPLARLREVFQSQGLDFPDVRVLTRSGDTPQSQRQRMLRRPPEILITTPESLNLLLSSRGGRSILTALQTVILDEIHAVCGSKRGTHLITAVERLTDFSGEFQRIALSATVRPIDLVAEFVGGFALSGSPQAPVYTPRRVALVESQEEKEYRLKIRFPEEIETRGPDQTLWEVLSGPFREIIAANRSTLFFVKGRRMAEKITRMINQDQEKPLAYAHHGSLSRELRLEVEQKLKNGELKAIVATSSLELGIDIGDLDEVVLIQSPFSISSAIQRLGRAGHQVGRASRGTLFPAHALDMVEAAVLIRAVRDRDLEETVPVSGPLDVLAQVLVSMAGAHAWDLDQLYARIRTAWPYRNLSREVFDLVLDMLAGRYAETPRPGAPAPAFNRPPGEHGGHPQGGPPGPLFLGRNHPGPGLLQPAPSGDRGPSGRAGRGVCVGGQAGPGPDPGHPELENPEDHPQRGAGPSRRSQGPGRALLAGRGV